MAKQTFSVGQTLTAAQMTSLQQTAMLGGAASAKTASYTLIAADAGTAISMSNAGATTITVNTGLFAAGDTVQITNLGAGVCTITAGTATVNSSASLALAQYESGTLDFTSASAAIFIKGAGAAASSGGMTLLQTLTCSGASVTSSTLSTDYTNLYIVGNGISASTNVAVFFRLNGDTGSNYNYSNAIMSGAGNPANDSTTTTAGNFGNCGTGTAFNTVFTFEMNVPRYNSTAYKAIQIQSRASSGGQIENYISSRHNWNNTAAITTLTFGVSSGTFSTGSIYIYGVK